MGNRPSTPEIFMKDLIIDAIDGSEPIDALNALFSVAFAVAVESGINEFTLSSLFSSHIEAQFEVAANAVAEEDDAEEAEEDEDEQTDN
jgi:hypothetical protein